MTLATLSKQPAFVRHRPAQEALQKVAPNCVGIAETNGASGVGNQLTAEDIRNAAVIIVQQTLLRWIVFDGKTSLVINRSSCRRYRRSPQDSLAISDPTWARLMFMKIGGAYSLLQDIAYSHRWKPGLVVISLLVLLAKKHGLCKNSYAAGGEAPTLWVSHLGSPCSLLRIYRGALFLLSRNTLKFVQSKLSYPTAFSNNLDRRAGWLSIPNGSNHHCHEWLPRWFGGGSAVLLGIVLEHDTLIWWAS